MAAASAIGTLVGSLNNIGLEDFAVSQGAPISVSTVGGVTTSTVGSPLSGTSGTLIIFGGLAILLWLLFGKGKVR